MSFDTFRDPSVLKWLYPGMHVKPWLALLVIGVAFMGLGIAYLLREAYTSYTFPGAFYYLTLQFFPRYVRGLLFMTVALSCIALGIWYLNQSLLSAVRTPGRPDRMVDLVYNYRFRARGPRIVAVVGGTGLSPPF